MRHPTRREAPPPPRPPSWWFRSTYQGAELGRTCMRPGAYDAFALPSLIGSRLHYRDGRVVPLEKAR